MDTDNTGPGSDDAGVEAGPPDVQRPEHEVEYLRRTPVRRRFWQRTPKAERARYIDTGAPGFRGAGEDHVVYVRRERLHRPWWRRRLIVIPLVLAVLLAAAGTYVLTQRNVTTEVPFAAVVERFEAEQPELTEDTDVEAVERDQPSEVVPGEATEGQDEDGTVDPGTARASKGPYEIPAEGVYAYQATGGENISLFGAKHEYPSRAYASVRHLGGCRWEERIDVIEEHVDVLRLCSRADEFLHVSQSRSVEFLSQRVDREYVCEPWASIHNVDDDKGARSSTTCRTADGDSSELTRTFVGREPFVVEGEIVEAVRIRIDVTFSGSSEGTSQDDLWVLSSTGLPLRWDREVDGTSDAFGARVRYTEDASFTLMSLDPQR